MARSQEHQHHQGTLSNADYHPSSPSTCKPEADTQQAKSPEALIHRLKPAALLLLLAAQLIGQLNPQVAAHWLVHGL